MTFFYDLATSTVDIGTARVIFALHLVLIAVFTVMAWRDA